MAESTAVAEPPVATPATPAPATQAAAPVAAATNVAAPAVKAPESSASPAQAAPAAAPAEIKLTAPEGVAPEVVANVTEFAKANGLNQKQAEAVLHRHTEAIEQHNTQLRENYQRQAQEWVKAVETDKEIGGQDMAKNVEYARKAIAKYATPELTKMLNDTGFGSHPEVVRVFTRIGRQMSEDTILSGGGPPATAERDARRIYPNSNMNP
jgi:hypothetical protein